MTAEERRKDYQDLSDLKVQLAVAVVELRNTNANIKKLDEQQQQHAVQIIELREKVNVSRATFHTGWMAASIFASVIGFTFKNILTFLMSFTR